MEKNALSNVAELRERAGLSQTQLAALMGVDTNTIRNWERGRSGLDWFVKLARLCEILECDPKDLVKKANCDRTQNEEYA